MFYEAISPERAKKFNQSLIQLSNKIKKLKTIIFEINLILENKFIVVHNKKHEEKIFTNSFLKLQQKPQIYNFICTLEMSYKLFPHLKSFSLTNLSKKFKLKYDSKFFNSNFAHNSFYDAIFTYQLYIFLINHKDSKGKLVVSNEKITNPFSSVRVDNPFQTHFDLKNIHKDEFLQIKNIIENIEHDQNKQSRGAVLVGNAGMGKSHLVMRLTNENLLNEKDNISNNLDKKSHKVLFTNIPNSDKYMLFNLYINFLNSFTKPLTSEYSQLDIFIAKTFFQIFHKHAQVSTFVSNTNTQIKEIWLKPLDLYEKILTTKNSSKYSHFRKISEVVNEWWLKNKGFDEFGKIVLKALLKYTYYEKTAQKNLVIQYLKGNNLNEEQLKLVDLEEWIEDLDKEKFALEVLKIFGNLSVEDAVLIFVFDQFEAIKDNQERLKKFQEIAKEIFTQVPNSLIITNFFPDTLDKIKEISKLDSSLIDRLAEKEIFLKMPSKDELIQLLNELAKNKNIDLNKIFNQEELEIILKNNSLRKLLKDASKCFQAKQENKPCLKELSQNIGFSEEIEKLKSEIIHLKNNKNDDYFIELQNLKKEFLLFKLEFEEIKLKLSDFENTETQEVKKDKKIEWQDEILQLENKLFNDYNQHEIISSQTDIEYLNTIFEQYNSSSYKRDVIISKKVIPENLSLEFHNKKLIFCFLTDESGKAIPSRLKNLNLIAISEEKESYFYIFRDIRSSKITGKTSLSEIEKTNHLKNTEFRYLDKEERVIFQLFYKTVTEIINRNIENISIQTAIDFLIERFPEYWISKTLKMEF